MIHGNRMGSGEAGARRIDVIVVGAGFAGMYATYKFRQMGKSVVGIEAGGDVGGVWYWNRYPGARCHLMSVDYSYGFSEEIELEWTWSEQFAAEPEILAYANFVADKLDLRRSYLFNTRVTSAVWDENAKVWRATTDKGETLEAPCCIMATGPLSVAKDPDIPGIKRFKGRLLRAQKWPHEPVGFEGKRVGVIGTGSTGIQIVQTIGRQAGELFVFQRTPSFTLPMRNHVLEPDYYSDGNERVWDRSSLPSASRPIRISGSARATRRSISRKSSTTVTGIPTATSHWRRASISMVRLAKAGGSIFKALPVMAGANPGREASSLMRPHA